MKKGPDESRPCFRKFVWNARCRRHTPHCCRCRPRGSRNRTGYDDLADIGHEGFVRHRCQWLPRRSPPTPTQQCEPKVFSLCKHSFSSCFPAQPSFEAAPARSVVRSNAACQNLIAKASEWSVRRLRIEEYVLTLVHVKIVCGTAAKGWMACTSIRRLVLDIARLAAEIPAFFAEAESWLRWNFPPIREDVPA